MSLSNLSFCEDHLPGSTTVLVNMLVKAAQLDDTREGCVQHPWFSLSLKFLVL